MRSCFYRWYRGQVVRQESAKLSSASSNLAGTSKTKRTSVGCPFCFGEIVWPDLKVKMQMSGGHLLAAGWTAATQ